LKSHSNNEGISIVFLQQLKTFDYCLQNGETLLNVVCQFSFTVLLGGIVVNTSFCHGFTR